MDELKNLSDRDILIQLHTQAQQNKDNIKGVWEKLDAFVKIVDNKIGREEFKDFKIEVRDVHKKYDGHLDTLEREFGAHCGEEKGKNDQQNTGWKKIVLWVGIMQFILGVLFTALNNS